jgi:hypothetical protein
MTRLSSLQYPVLKLFAGGKFFSIADCQKLDQRPFRSMLVREYVAYFPGKGFGITQAGLAAWDDFRFRGYLRQNPSLPLTCYFDPVAYGLDPLRPKAKVHVLEKRGAA